MTQRRNCGMNQKPDTRLRVLVVDDEPTSREVLSRGVERLGYETMVADDAASAMAILSKERFHVVITDKNMPGTDHPTEGGLDVIRFAKKVNPGCAVLMMTSYATLESAIEALQFGAFDYVTKPVRFDDLKAKLTRVLQYQQTIDPAGTISAHNAFLDEIFAILNREAADHYLDDEDKARLLTAVQQQIDNIFRERREWEQLIFEQREALTRIAGWVEELRESLPAAGRVADLLDRISSVLSHRV